jgi:adenosylmethionine-8-amino-7-oxononanoate aminotransferase
MNTGHDTAGIEPGGGGADHLWPHFAKLPVPGGTPLRVICRGQGTYVWDADGNRYLDGLAGLFVVQAGHGRRRIAEAALEQGAVLGYFPLWNYAHPPGLELAARLAALAPGELNRVFFTSGGGEAVESAWKLARQHFLARGETERVKVIARRQSYHGTTLGALSITGLEPIREPFRPLLNGQTRHVATTNRLHCELCSSAPACTLACADDVEQAILAAGPETVAAVFLEPVQNAGGCFVPAPGYWQRVREICDRHGVLLVSDEVICAFGRLGTWFGADRFGYQPDMITFAKGVTSGYAPLGGVLVSDRLAEPFLDGSTSFLHGLTFAGHPVSCAVALANLDVMEEEDLPGRVRDLEGELRHRLDDLSDLPMVAEVRGTGYFHALELDRAGAPFSADEREWLIRTFLPPRLLELGLMCRVDDRVRPMIQLSPPLIAGPEEFEHISTTLRQVLLEAWKELDA